jgi:uncharacterized membrane protein YozB (DUF420 family)
MVHGKIQLSGHIMSSGIFFQIQSTLILILFSFGIFTVMYRKKRILHSKIMYAGIIWDLLLIVQIELNRKAIEKAIQVTKNSSILSIHIMLALSCVILYMFMIYLGRKILKGNSRLIPRHRMFGRLTLIMRVSTYITSFWVV